MKVIVSVNDLNLLSIHPNRAVELSQNFIVQGNFPISEQKLNNVISFWKDDFKYIFLEASPVSSYTNSHNGVNR